MTRTVAALLLLAAAPVAATAAPAQRQPTPQAVTAAVTPSAPTAPEPDAMRKAQAESVARDKAWDAAMRKTMSGVCRGC